MVELNLIFGRREDRVEKRRRKEWKTYLGRRARGGRGFPIGDMRDRIEKEREEE